MNLTKKLAATALSAALVCTLLPVPAFAATTSDSTAATETRTVQWTSLEEQPEFAKTISVSGVEYTLTGTPSIKEIKSETGKVPADHTETIECWPNALDATIASFSDTWTIDTDEASGSIPKEGVSYTAQEARRSWEVNATQTYTGLPTNDVDQIAAEISYNNPDTGNDLTLALASISWDVTGYDARGRANSYTANCIYRGEDSDVVVDHYVVTATWAGQVDSKTPVITYEATLIYAAPETETAPAIEVETEVQSQPFNWLPVAVGVAAAAGFSGLLGAYWHRSRFRIVKREQDVEKTVARVAIKKKEGTLEVVIPSSVAIETPGRFIGYMPRKWVKRGWPCKVMKADGSVITEGKTQATYDLKALLLTVELSDYVKV